MAILALLLGSYHSWYEFTLWLVNLTINGAMVISWLRRQHALDRADLTAAQLLGDERQEL